MVYDLLLSAEFTNNYLFLGVCITGASVFILASEMRDSAENSQGIFQLDSRGISPPSADEDRVFQLTGMRNEFRRDAKTLILSTAR